MSASLGFSRELPRKSLTLRRLTLQVLGVNEKKQNSSMQLPRVINHKAKRKKGEIAKLYVCVIKTPILGIVCKFK